MVKRTKAQKSGSLDETCENFSLDESMIDDRLLMTTIDCLAASAEGIDYRFLFFASRVFVGSLVRFFLVDDD